MPPHPKSSSCAASCAVGQVRSLGRQIDISRLEIARLHAEAEAFRLELNRARAQPHPLEERGLPCSATRAAAHVPPTAHQGPAGEARFASASTSAWCAVHSPHLAFATPRACAPRGTEAFDRIDGDCQISPGEWQAAPLSVPRAVRPVMRQANVDACGADESTARLSAAGVRGEVRQLSARLSNYADGLANASLPTATLPVHSPSPVGVGMEAVAMLAQQNTTIQRILEGGQLRQVPGAPGAPGAGAMGRPALHEERRSGGVAVECSAAFNHRLRELRRALDLPLS